MSNLKSLTEKIGMGFSPRNSKTKTRLGLHHFVAATTDQMLMTRGGYGAKTRIACMHGNPGQCDRFPCNKSYAQLMAIGWGKTSYANGGKPWEEISGFIPNEAAMRQAFINGARNSLLSGGLFSYRSFLRKSPWFALVGGLIGSMYERSRQIEEWLNSNR